MGWQVEEKLFPLFVKTEVTQFLVLQKYNYSGYLKIPFSGLIHTCMHYLKCSLIELMKICGQ